MDKTKNWIGFGNLDLIFKVTAVEKLKIQECGVGGHLFFFFLKTLLLLLFSKINICVRCQSLFSGENKRKNIINLSSGKFAQRGIIIVIFCLLQILQYIERSLRSHKNQIEAVTAQLSNCVDKEVHQFASLSLPYLMFSNIDK